MKRFLAKKWVVPAAALILTLSIGSAAFAVTGSSTDTSTAAGPSATEQRGGQRSDETLLTGDALSKVTAAALAKVGSDATVDRAETDADGNAKYEAHVTKADGSHVTVYLDDSFAVVSVEDQPAGGPGGGHGGRGGSSDDTTGSTGAGSAAGGSGSAATSSL